MDRTKFLTRRLADLHHTGAHRSLPGTRRGIDFWSNDYLGFSRFLEPSAPTLATAPGSRLISGDHAAIAALEEEIAAFHGFPAALLFTSGYAANTGLLSCLGRRTDTFLYDEWIHASMRDGIRLSGAAARRCPHNHQEEWAAGISRARTDGEVFCLTEARFSMDGDTPPLAELARLCSTHGAHLIVDEAHSIGVDGQYGAGRIAALHLQQQVFATVITYGKAPGFHGAAVLGSAELRDYLINFSRPFIFTTAPRPAQVEGIRAVYALLPTQQPEQRQLLGEAIRHFRDGVAARGLGHYSPEVEGPIQTIRVPGNAAVMRLEALLQEAGYLVKGIRSPSVAAGEERLRICLHAFNTREEVSGLVTALAAALESTPA